MNPDPEANGADKIGDPGLQSLLDDVSHSVALPTPKTELILIELDPHRAHVYWNIEPARIDPARPLVLRVYDITGTGDIANAEQTYDVEVNGPHGRWYIDCWRDDRTFVAGIGYRQADGSLDTLARSNEIHTPPAHAVETDAFSLHLDPNGRPVRTELPFLEPPAPDEKDVPGAIEPIQLLDPDFPLAEWIEARVAEAESAGMAAMAEAAGEAAVAFVDASEVQGLYPLVFPDAEALKDFVPENDEAVQAYYRTVECLPPPPEPEVAPEPVASSTSTPPEAEPPVTKSMALEHFIGCSSLEFAGRREELEVHAELHIYGRAKPGTRLTLYGQTLVLQPDGAFSIRRPIPAGAMVIPLLKV